MTQKTFSLFFSQIKKKGSEERSHFFSLFCDFPTFCYVSINIYVWADFAWLHQSGIRCIFLDFFYLLCFYGGEGFINFISMFKSYFFFIVKCQEKFKNTLIGYLFVKYFIITKILLLVFFMVFNSLLFIATFVVFFPFLIKK